MRQLLRAGTVACEADTKDDPFRYGWRYVRRTQPDGTEAVDQVPLSLDDLLYPEEGDFVGQEPIHLRDFLYCHSTLEGFYAAQPSVVVLGDCRVDWGVAGVRPLGPDIVVFLDVQQWLRRGTFHLTEEGGRPVLAVEVTSPSTPMQAGNVVVMVAHVFGLWWVNACRIVYVLNEHAPLRRFGFAYGTLPGHVECGEECFSVAWYADDTVWYAIRSFSRPRYWLARLGYPLVRRLQRRFVRASQVVMQQAVEQVANRSMSAGAS